MDDHAAKRKAREAAGIANVAAQEAYTAACKEEVIADDLVRREVDRITGAYPNGRVTASLIEYGMVSQPLAGSDDYVMPTRENPLGLPLQ